MGNAVSGTGRKTRASNKETAQLLRKVTKAGGTYERRRSGHFMVTGPNGSTPISASPGGGCRGRENALSDLRAIGLEV